MKTSTCSGNESVSWHKGTWRITVKDDIALQFSWYFVRLLRAYAPNSFDWHSNVWDLKDPFEHHANSCKQIEMTGR